MNNKINVSLLILFFAFASISNGQQLLIDKGIQVKGLWCFPVLKQENSYYYLSSHSRLGMTKDSLPEFSFMRYVMDGNDENDSASSIVKAAGGGILHFLVLYDTPSEQVKSAEEALRKKLDNDEIILKGPVIFNSAKYMLISSILTDDGTKKSKLMGSGEASVLENDKLALSFNIDPLHSKLLLESFKMATPDISIIFELNFSGLTDNYEAQLEINWDEVKKSKSYSAGGSVYFIGADVEVAIDEMRKNQAIKLIAIGNNDSMEGLVQTVYDKLIEMLFKPVEPASLPSDERGGLEDALSSFIGQSGSLGSRNSTGFRLNVGYKHKELSLKGEAVLNFNGRSTVERKHIVTFNIGNLYKKYGSNKEVFKDISMDDPTFQKRKIVVGVDGSLKREFEKMINSVTVTLRKVHADNSVTLKNILVDKYFDLVKKTSLNYLNQGDSDRMEWLNFEYRTVWQFTGGGSLENDWKSHNASMINLYTPFRRHRIELEGDLSFMDDQNIKTIIVKVTYPFFKEQKSERRIIRRNDDLSSKIIDITLPNEIDDVNYTIVWFKNDGTKVEQNGVDSYGLIFIDEIPEK